MKHLYFARNFFALFYFSMIFLTAEALAAPNQNKRNKELAEITEMLHAFTNHHGKKATTNCECCSVIIAKLQNLQTTLCAKISTVDSKLDACCETINSKLDTFELAPRNIEDISEFVNEFTNQHGAKAVANCECCSIIIARLQGLQTTLCSKIATVNACCETINSKLDALEFAPRNLADLTELAHECTNQHGVKATTNCECCSIIIARLLALQTTLCAKIATVGSKLDFCCETLNSKIDIVDKDVSKVDAHLAACCLTLNSKLDVINTLPQSTFSKVCVIESKLDRCCFTLSSKIDRISCNGGVSIPCDICGTFTVLQAIQSKEQEILGTLNDCCANLSNLSFAILGDVEDIGTSLSRCCFTINSKLDVPVSVLSKVCVIESKLDRCCFTINSKLDNLSCTCSCGGASIPCDICGTFTVLQAIENKQDDTLSKLDGCCVNLNNLSLEILNVVQGVDTKLDHCCFTVNSKLDFVSSDLDQCCFTISSKIDTIVINASPCAHTPLTIPATGTVISAPGAYCLTSDVTLNPGAGVVINGTDIVLDLNDHTITGGTGSTDLMISNSRVTVHNGSIRNGATGLSVGAFSNIYIHDLSINGCTADGFDAFGATEMLLERVNVSDCGFAGFVISGGTTPFFQPLITSCVTLRNCISSNNVLGFDLARIAAVLDSCFACNNSGTGFLVESPNPPNVNIPSANVCLVRCASKANSTGFAFGGTAQIKYIADECEANGNGTGFAVFGVMGLPNINGIITHCKAINNIDGFDFNSTSSGNIVEYCTANQNTGFGFSSAAPIADNVFAFNSAAFNGVNYNGVAHVSGLGGASYGDNITAP